MEQGQGQLPVNFNLSDARDMACECGNNMFMQGYRFKKVSRLLTGGAKDTVLPVEVYICTQCSKPLQDLLPQELQDTKITE
jgi:DNA-directed RNA polymerase subunit RPC12/RpoP